MYTLNLSEKFAVMQALQVAKHRYQELATIAITPQLQEQFTAEAANFAKLTEIFNSNDVIA